MIKMLFASVFVLTVFASLGQEKVKHNDTLFYKSGSYKAVDVIEFDDKFITYNYFNKEGNQSSTHTIKIKSLKYFVVYNRDDIIEFSSLAGKHIKKTARID